MAAILSRPQCVKLHMLNLSHWGRVTHMCVGNLTNIGSDNGLLPGRPQAIIWTNAAILFIGPLGTKLQWNFNSNSYIFIQENPFKMSHGKWLPFCLGLSVLSFTCWIYLRKHEGVFAFDISPQHWNISACLDWLTRNTEISLFHKVNIMAA